jgi:hypothetical protein
MRIEYYFTVAEIIFVDNKQRGWRSRPAEITAIDRVL